MKRKKNHYEKNLEEQKKHYEEKIQDKEEHFRQMKEIAKEESENKEKQFKQLFENIAQKNLQSKAEYYQKESEKSLNSLLSPLKEKITGFEKTVRECYNEEGKQRFSLKNEIEKIAETNQNLTQALKGNTKIQGDWGEVILERILENSGLQKGEGFTIQGKELGLKNKEGKSLKPDFVVHLPDDRDIIIDSKVSLTHYYNYISSQSEEEKNQCVKQIVDSLHQHIKNLSEKQYHKTNLNTLDFVLMFIPIEAVLSLAIQEEKSLFEQALKKSIVIVSPITLHATLKTIHALWQIAKQNKNAKDIAKESGYLYNKFRGFLNSMIDLGKGLKNAQISYDKANNQLHTGQGNLIDKAEKIKKLGANTNKSLPEKFIPNKTDDKEIYQIKESVVRSITNLETDTQNKDISGKL